LVLAVERLGKALGVEVALSARWGEVMLRIGEPATARLHWIGVSPVGVDMGKVRAANALFDRLCNGEVGLEAAQAQLAAIRQSPPVSLLRFAVMAAAGAAALGVIFGAGQWLTLSLIALAAGAGAVLRRWFATLGDNAFAQPFDRWAAFCNLSSDDSGILAGQPARRSGSAERRSSAISVSVGCSCSAAADAAA